MLQMPAFQQQQQTSSRSMDADSHDHQQLDNSQQHWDSEADEEVCSFATAAHEQGSMVIPLHRVKRVWSHLCMMELSEDDCFDA